MRNFLKIFSKFILTSFLIMILLNEANCDYKGIPEDRIFSMDALRKYFTINKDKEFIIQVAGNPTRGYLWHLDKISDNDNLKPLNLDQKKSPKDYEKTEALGDIEGIFYFKFKGLKKGVYYLLFINKRPWENKNLKERRITIEIN